GEPDLTVRVIRDVFNEDFSKLVVSGDKAWTQVQDYLSSVAPDLAQRLEKWTGETDVFAVHRIDEQLAKAMDRKVWLPSGGTLVIDRTEAMTVIDVNTGKFVGSGGNLEETVTKNNLEAAEEIVRQMRLRDIGGIIVVDFIDMVLESNRDLVVRRLLECLGRDRTKHQVAEVTSLGLVQMTRKRVGSGLVEVFSEPCEHCAGRGIIVHTDPVDKPAVGNPAASSKSRRSKARKGAEEPAKPAGGPTAAQIAAAAHAAAQSPAKSQDSAEGQVYDAPAAPAESATDGGTNDGSATNGSATNGSAAAVTGRAGSQRPTDDSADTGRQSAEPAVPSEAQAAEQEQAEPPEPVRKSGRARRRATSAAGAAHHIEASAPVVVPETQPAAPAEPVAEAAAATVVEAQPVKPRRKKRARVVAPAGPPVAETE
ncbi:MAG: ribonuclease E/G, partial [Microlunatus sp.]|nr:ribonuclease E/G [Microlunatus sp.]